MEVVGVDLLLLEDLLVFCFQILVPLTSVVIDYRFNEDLYDRHVAFVSRPFRTSFK